MDTETQQLIREFQQLKSLELQAKDLYDSLLRYISDPEDKRLMMGVIRDEEKHANLAQQIIDILSQ